jgi:cytochrome c553
MQIASCFMVSMAALLVAGQVTAAGATDIEARHVTRLKPNLTLGAQQFSVCAACHGSEGGGQPDGSVPAIAGQYFPVVVKQLLDFRRGKRWDIRMEQFADRHRLADAQAIANVAAYAGSMPRIPAAPDDKESLSAAGGVIYARQCAACHGAGGEGSAVRVIPWMNGQQSAYLLRQFYDAVDSRRPSLKADHARLLEDLDRDQLQGLASYINRLAVAGSPGVNAPRAP